MKTRYTMGLAIAIGLLHGHCRAEAAGIAGRYVETSNGVIFSKEVSKATRVCAELRECWTPSRANIEVLEKDLSAFLAKSKVWGAAEISHSLPSYKRKYYGFRKSSARYILTNGLCQKFWRTGHRNFESPERPMTDMGSCYFLIEYDVARRTFSNYYVDGDG